jgi:4-hydroxy-tetrahydrodipicolinate synthase
MRAALAEVACDVIGNGKRIILGVHAPGLTGILKNMERLARFKHTHWTAMLPSGIGKPSEPVRYVHSIADHADRPFFFYYVPGANGIRLTPGQFRDILSHPNVAGVKNSAGAMRIRKQLLLLKQEVDFELYEGDEWAVDEALALGCDGIIVGFGSMGGRIMRAIAAAAEQKDYARTHELQMELVRILHAVYGETVPYWCIGQKYGLHRMGILSSYKTLVDGQQELPAQWQAQIDRCVEDHPEWFAAQ